MTDYIGKARAISSLYSEIESLNNAIEFLKNNKGNVIITNRVETERIDVKSTLTCYAIIEGLKARKDYHVKQLEIVLENLSTEGSDT